LEGATADYAHVLQQQQLKTTRSVASARLLVCLLDGLPKFTFTFGKFEQQTRA